MKIGLHYSFQTAPGEDRGRIVAGGLDDIRRADAAGFSSVVFAEHHFLEDGWLPRPMMLAAAAASVTSKMRVGTDIVILALHHPVAVAEETAVLDLLSGGRALLGLGLGWMKAEFEGFGVPFRRRARIYERSIGIVRALLRGETVSDDGHYRLREARLRPPPTRPDLPVWLGALEDVGVERAARLGDAWIMPPGNRLGRLVEQRELLLEVRDRAGLPAPAEQPLRREAFVAESDDRAWELFAAGLRHEYGLVYRPLHPTYPEDDSTANLRRWGEDMFVVGAPETVAAELGRYEAACAATEVLVRFQLPGVAPGAVAECLDGLAEVVALLRDRG